MNQETRVGIFVIISIALFAFVILLLGDVRVNSRNELNILFTDVSGLPPKAPVKISGVDVGTVGKIVLHNGKAKVIAKIKKGIKIHKDARATIASTGVIGSKYLDLTTGTKTEPVLESGAAIEGVSPYSMELIIEKVMNSVESLLDSVGSLTGKDGEESPFGRIIKNIDELTASLNEVITDNKDTLDDSIGRFSNILVSFEKTAKNLDKLVAKIVDGEGTLGELVSDDEIADDVKQTVKSLRQASTDIQHITKRVGEIKMEWDTEIRYNFDDSETRTDFGIRIRPNDRKYYFVGVDNISSNGDGEFDTGDQKNNSVTALIAKDMPHWYIYGGAIKSTGGVGLGFIPWANKRVLIGVDAYRFGRTVEDETKPWLDAAASYRFVRWGYVKVGIEDMLERSGFSGSLNLVIQDDDLSYLLGLFGLSTYSK
ncbi:MlaD family protein [bacterium]